jgi:hypothetical protein
VRHQGAPALDAAAQRALAKIATANPGDLRDHMAETRSWSRGTDTDPGARELAEHAAVLDAHLAGRSSTTTRT